MCYDTHGKRSAHALHRKLYTMPMVSRLEPKKKWHPAFKYGNWRLSVVFEPEKTHASLATMRPLSCTHTHILKHREKGVKALKFITEITMATFR